MSNPSIVLERSNAVPGASALPDPASPRFRVAIFVSGGGSNMEALIRAAEKGGLPRAEIALVICNRPDAGAVPRAQSHGIETAVIASKGAADQDFQASILSALIERRIDVICLAGYLKKVGSDIVQRYRGRILNIHPALLPRYGGAGMYGRFVHEAVLKAGDKESGCSVHLVDDEFDHGPHGRGVAPGARAVAAHRHNIHMASARIWAEPVRVAVLP